MTTLEQVNNHETLTAAADRARGLVVLAQLWAAAVLFSQASTFIWTGGVFGAGGPHLGQTLELLAVLSAALVLLSRFCPRRFALALVLETANLIARLPELPNHCHVLLFVNFFFLAALAKHFVRGVELGAYVRTHTVHFIQALTVVLYAYAFFAKLNTTYIDQSASCSVTFYNNIAAYLGLPANSVMYAMVIHGSLVVELLLPLLLLSRRFRVAGVGLGLLFHYSLAFDLIKYFTNFSSVMFLLLLSFMPLEYLVGVHDRCAKYSRHLRIFAAAMLLLIAVPGAYSELGPRSSAEIAWRTCVANRHAAWVIYSSVNLVFFFQFARQFRAAGSRLLPVAPPLNRFGTASVFEWAILLLAILNGLSPYAGFKTRTGFNMYSNLRIEPDYSNHLLIPHSFDPFNFFAEHATVSAIDASDSRTSVCGGALQVGSVYPLVELARRVRECPGETFAYYYEGTRFISISDSSWELLNLNSSWLSRKLAIFRPMDDRAATDCIW